MRTHARRLLLWILLVLLGLQCMVPATAAEEALPDGTADDSGGMEVFQLAPEDIHCSFTDVSENDWYYSYAAYAQSLGLVNGRTATEFAPYAKMTVVEAIVLAVRIYEKYHAISSDSNPRGTWYDSYVARAKAYGILPPGCENYTDLVRRDQAAAIFCSVLPSEELQPRNEVDWIPDVHSTDPYYEQILTLYRAGVLSGTNEYGVFHPDHTATRAELVAILCAVINPSLRKDVALPECNISVFTDRQPETYDCSFTDIPESAWYYTPVCCQETLEIMNGVGAGRFDPGGTVTLAQALKVAVVVYEQYHNLPNGEKEGPWYAYYVEKALDYGILSDQLRNYNRFATRGEVVLFLSRSLSETDLQQRNPVDDLPDVSKASSYFSSTLLLYRAGIMRGSDAAGVANLESNITRAELAALLTRLVLPKERLQFELAPWDSVTFTYGTSGSGNYPLTAYRIGSGDNLMVLTFAIHGWEDHWSRDGQELVDLADQTKAYLEEHMDLVNDGNWSVYILRCLNPDGLNLGYSHDGPGRCTTTRLDENENLLTDYGIDMNRCFPYHYVSYTSSRNFNGTAPLQCVEAQKLAKLITELPQAERRIFIDVHGWYGEILTTSGKGALYEALHAQFPKLSHMRISGGNGFLSAWAGYELGFDSVLLELPYSIYSHGDFVKANCVTCFTAAIADLLKNY